MPGRGWDLSTWREEWIAEIASRFEPGETRLRERFLTDCRDRLIAEGGTLYQRTNLACVAAEYLPANPHLYFEDLFPSASENDYVTGFLCRELREAGAVDEAEQLLDAWQADPKNGVDARRMELRTASPERKLELLAELALDPEMAPWSSANWIQQLDLQGDPAEAERVANELLDRKPEGQTRASSRSWIVFRFSNAPSRKSPRIGPTSWRMRRAAGFASAKPSAFGPAWKKPSRSPGPMNDLGSPIFWLDWKPAFSRSRTSRTGSRCRACRPPPARRPPRPRLR